MNYKRLFVFILCTLLSYKAFIASLGVYSIFGNAPKEYEIIIWLTNIWIIVSSYAWVAYFVMNWLWVNNKTINLTYMKSGYIAGIISMFMVILTPIGFAIIFALPAILLATALLNFHSNKYALKKA